MRTSPKDAEYLTCQHIGHLKNASLKQKKDRGKAAANCTSVFKEKGCCLSTEKIISILIILAIPSSYSRRGMVCRCKKG